MSLNSKPRKETAYAALGLPVIWTAESTFGAWPETGVTISFDNPDGDDVVFAPTSFSIDGMVALWNLSAAQVATLSGLTSWRIQIDGAWPRITGYLSWGSGWEGSTAEQSLGTVVLGPQGPEGPTAVSADAGNNATLGTDGLIYVSPTAVAAHVIQDEGTPLTSRAALNFAGAGVTVTDDAGNGATLVTIPSGGGATTLDALTDVTTAGQSTGKALVTDGANWTPSAAAVVLTDDARLADARNPLAHNHAQSDVTGLTDALAGKAAALGADDNYVSDAEKVKLSNLSGTNSGDQTLPTWSTIAGKPVVVAEGANAEIARDAIGAAQSGHTHPVTEIWDSTTTGRAVMKAASAAAARTAIGAGTSSLVIGTGAGDAKAGDYAPDLSVLVPKSLVDAKGDLIVATAADTVGRLAVGATTGHVLTVNPATATGLEWAAGGGGSSVPTPYPRIVGRYYGPPGLGSQNTDANIFGTSGAVMFLSPFYVGAGGQPIDRLRQNIAAAGNGLLWLGVYGPGDATSGGFGTATRVVHASADATTTGDKILTVSATLPAGTCWLAVATTDTTGTLRVLRGNFNSTGPHPLLGAGDASIAAGGALKFTGLSLGSGLPATINLSTYNVFNTNDQGIIYVRTA